MARSLSGSVFVRSLGVAFVGTAVGTALTALAVPALAQGTNQPAFRYTPAADTARAHPAPVIDVTTAPATALPPAPPAPPQRIGPIAPAAKPARPVARQAAQQGARPDKVYSTAPAPVPPKASRPSSDTSAKPNIPDKVYSTRSLSSQPSGARRERQVTPVNIQVEPVVPIRTPRDRYRDARPRDPQHGRDGSR